MKLDPYRDLRKTAWDIYTNDHAGYLLTMLYARYSDKVAQMFEKFLDPVQNPLRRIARLQAVTYTTPVHRTSGNGDLDRLVLRLAPGLDAALGEAEAAKFGCADSFLLAYWAAISKRIRFKLIPSYQVEPKFTDTSEVEYYEHNAAVRYYTDGRTSEKGATGKKEWSDPVKSYPACPLVWFRANPQTDEIWSIESVADLVYGTLEIGLSEMLNNYSEYLRSFKLLYLEQTTNTMDDTRAVASMDLDPESIAIRKLGTLELSDPKNPHYDNIRKKIEDLASTRGISGKTYFSTDPGIYASPELRKIWRESSKYQLEPEQQLLSAIVGIAARYVKDQTVPAMTGDWVIDYHEPTPDDGDAKKELETLELAIRLGVDCQRDFLLRKNREIVTNEEADAKLDDIAESKARVNELNIERNQPADLKKTPDAMTPAENGAIGGQISAELRGEYDGAEGPRITTNPV